MAILPFTSTPYESTPAAWVPQPAPSHPVRKGWFLPLRAAWRRHRSRIELARLNDFMLKDIGLTRAEAEIEARKPFWYL